MKKLYLYFPVIIFLFTICSCEDTREEHLDKYSTVLYFLKSGQHDVTLYKTGENSIIPVDVYKAGYNMKATPSATMGILDDKFLEAYNLENATNLKIIPQKYYKTVLPEIRFESDEMLKAFEIEFETDLIDKELDLEGEEYVLPLYIYSADTVNTKMNYILLRPSIAIPVLYLSEPKVVYYNFNEGEDQVSFSLDIVVPFTNLWELECTFEFDNTLFDEGLTVVTYEPLEGGYTISNVEEGKVIIQPGETHKTIEVVLDKSKLPYGNFGFPFRLKNVSKEGVMIDNQKDACFVGLSYAPVNSKLSRIALTADMLSTNASEGEGALEYILDSDPTTYFHSRYNNSGISDDGLAHYILMELKDSYTYFSFNYQNREYNNGCPGEIIVSGSVDGKNFVHFGHIPSDLPTTGGSIYFSQVFVSPIACKYFRFMVPKNKDGGSFFSLAEFTLNGLK